MDNNSNNNTKARASFAEACNNKDSSVSDNPWPDNRREQTKRDRSSDAECSGDRVSYNKRVLNNYNVSQPAMPMPTGLDMVPSTNSNMNPYAFMGIPGENMYPVLGMGNYCQYGGVPTQENMFFPPVKEVVRLTKCVLYPPNPDAPRPTTRERPLGCKTVFVGGLPEKITEEIIKEIFERCGTVETVRMSKKNFCHIRFSEEIYVDNAIYFSGYRLKIENKDEVPFTGRLHVDYAQARDDQHDYECKQRALQRKARHQEQDYYRPPTPPPVVDYTDKEASLICEKLKNEETFTLATSILITWLEKGECTKKNVNSFFSMIQSFYNHMIKLQVDIVKYEEQLNEAKKMYKKQLEGIILQFTEIGKIYKAALLQKNWDQFTKAQRKNIEMWKRQTEELKSAHLEEVINEREDEEMELSDDENGDKTNTDVEQIRKQYQEDVHKYQEKADSLQCQLEAVQNEIVVMQSDHKDELKRKDDQMATMRQALESSKKELNLNQKRAKDQSELKELRAFKRKYTEDHPNIDNDSAYENNCHQGNSTNDSGERKTRLIGLISIFLNSHPFGSKIDCICAYLHQIDPTIRSRDVENLLKSYPMTFREVAIGIGASLGKKWHFTGF